MSRLPVPRGSRGGQLTQHRQHPLTQLQREMDNLFDQFFGAWPAPTSHASSGPRLWDFDVRQEGDGLQVRAEMPGFEPDEIEVFVDDSTLAIRAEKEQRQEGREEYASYYRTLPLPAGINADRVRADYRNGVLELHLPRAEGNKGRRIQVQSAQGQGGQGAGGTAPGQSTRGYGGSGAEAPHGGGPGSARGARAAEAGASPASGPEAHAGKNAGAGAAPAESGSHAKAKAKS